MPEKSKCVDRLVSKSQVQEIIRNYFRTPAELNVVDDHVISNGLGFLSDVNRMTLHWKVESNQALPKTIIVKYPKIDNLKSILDSLGSNSTVDNGYIALLHQLECTALEMLERDKPIPIPRIFGMRLITIDSPGLIVMEDMGDKGVIAKNIVDGVSLAQWRNVVVTLADLHAWSLTTDIPWRDRLPGVEALSGLFRNSETCLYGARKIKEKYPDYFGRIDEERIAEEMDSSNLKRKQDILKELTDEVMRHGDVWVNNIIFAKRVDGSMGEDVAAFLDWQMSTKGPGVTDLAKFEIWCVNYKMRRAHSESMLHLYYERFREKAGAKSKISDESLNKAYQLAFVDEGLTFVLFLEAILKNFGKVDEDESGRRKEEMLQRTKAAYEDIADLLGWSDFSP